MTIRRHLRGKAGAAVLATGLAVGATVVLTGTAQAGVCNGLTGAAGSCTTLGTVTLSGAGLTMVSPTALTWTGAITGATQTVYASLATDQFLDVLDLRGAASSAGWNITASATTFTGTVSGKTLTD